MAIFQHRYTKACPTGFVIQLAVDALKEGRGRPVACVLMHAAEVTVFHHEVLSTGAVPADRLAVPVDPRDFWADDRGRLWLMTYSQLSKALAVPSARPVGDLRLLLHMGCGQYTWDVVKGSHDLWKWALGFEDGFGKPTVWVYTISNIEESLYRDAPATRLSAIGARGPRALEWLGPEGFDRAVAQLQQENAAHRELRGKMLETPQPPAPAPAHTNRAVVFAPKDRLLEACERNNMTPLGNVELESSMDDRQVDRWIKLLRQDQHDTKAFVVRSDVGTIGTVHNLGTVLVLPVQRGWFLDEQISRVVFRRDLPMSQAEVRYACRVAFVPSDTANNQVVSIFTTRDEFNKLPPTPTDPPAFTADWPAVLLELCSHSYLDGGRPSPIRLPIDKRMVNEYLMKLEMRGLTAGRGGPLTQLGKLTCWWYQSGGIRDLDVANLLAVAHTAPGPRASALMLIAAVLYRPDSSFMAPITSLLKFQAPKGVFPNLEALLEQEVDGMRQVAGFALSYVARGPIWIAIAVWASRRLAMRQVDTSEAPDVSICGNALLVSQQALHKIQKNWEAMSHAWTTGLGRPNASQNPAIDLEDFLFLEESIARVWMHNLVLVGTGESGLGAFARDLTSGSPIERPVGDPVNWATLITEIDSEPPDESQPYTGVFGIYTALYRSTGPDGKIQYVPENLSFVSTRAARHVLRDSVNSRPSNGYPPTTWRQLLRTQCEAHCEPGQGWS